MNDQDISGFGSYNTQDPNYVATPSTVPGAGTSTSSNSSSSSQSTIQQSQLEEMIQMMVAGFPVLMPPLIVPTSLSELNGENGNSVSGVGAASASNAAVLLKLASDFEKMKHAIITDIWDIFMEGLRQSAERAKKKDFLDSLLNAQENGPKSSAEYYAFVMAMSAAQRATETDSALTVQFRHAFEDWIVNPMQGNSFNVVSINPISGQAVTDSSAQDFPNSSFIVGALTANSELVRQAIGAVSLTLGAQISTSPIADALFAVGPTSGLPVDSQAAAAMIAALLNGGAVAKASSDTIKQAASGVQPPRDLDFAINYAKQIMAIVTHPLESEATMPASRAEQNQLVRLMLTTMALNMVYRSAYGGMSGEELASILQGNTEDLPEEIKPLIDQLVGLIKLYLPKDPEARREAIANLMEYVDSKDSVDSMLETTHIFSGLLSTDDIDHNRRTSQGG